MNKRDADVDIERIAWNVQEAAAALGIDRERMGGLVRINAVPNIRIGQRALIGRRALEDWLTEGCMANLAEAASKPPSALRPLRRSTARRASGT